MVYKPYLLLLLLLYADDTCILLNGKHLDDLIIRTNSELELLFTWLQANKLSLNRQKTYNIIFHRARIKVTNYPSTLVMGGSILTVTTNEIKYIGVIIDDKITWIPHITYIKNKVSKGIDLMFKAKK